VLFECWERLEGKTCAVQVRQLCLFRLIVLVNVFLHREEPSIIPCFYVGGTVDYRERYFRTVGRCVSRGEWKEGLPISEHN